MRIFIACVIALVILVGGAFLINNNNQDNLPDTVPSTSTTPSTTTTPDSSKDNTSPAHGSNGTITYTDNGFSPSTLTLKAGSKLTVTNNSSRLLQFDSDPHPQHTDDPELNIGDIAPGQSQTITVSTTGSHGYHNHLNSDQTGTLVVQ